LTEVWPKYDKSSTLGTVKVPWAFQSAASEPTSRKPVSAVAVGIAVSILAAAGTVPVTAIEGVTFLGELGLDGQLRPVCGVLPAVAGAAAAGFRKVAVPETSAPEATLVPELAVLGAPSLGALLAWLRGERKAGQEVTVRMSGEGAGVQPVRAAGPGAAGLSGAAGPLRPFGQAGGRPDLADVLGQPSARRAAEICAAGGHHLSLVGPPGAGKTMLAERIPTVLPSLDRPAALEVTATHSVAGTLPAGSPLMTEPPFCAPHHTATKAAIVGGGSGIIRPGAASLAHRGCLFLDEAPEFGRDVLDALRQPLESGEVVVARLGMTARFPARFTLVLAANPCPCAKGPSGAGCTCTPTERRRYQARLSGPLLDRVDVKVEFLPVGRAELLSDRGFAEPSSVVVKRVEAARERAAVRLRHSPWRLNAEIPGSELRRSFAPGPGALAPLERAMDLGEISARGVDRVIRVAWTLADLVGVARPTVDETSYALGLWLGVAR
jgi:magnesium chelatase family protein